MVRFTPDGNWLPGTAVIIALFALAGWASGEIVLASWRAAYIPMAPSTALSFLVLAAAISAARRWPGPKGVWIARSAVLLVFLVATLHVLSAVTGFEFAGKRWLAHGPMKFLQFQRGIMSPLTAALFMTAGLGSALRISAPPLGELRSATARQWLALCGLVIAVVGGVIMLSYLYGSPLFYRGNVMIPMALSTGTAFSLLGVDLLRAADRSAWPTRYFVGPSVGATLTRVLAPVSMVLLMMQGFVIVRLDDTLDELHAVLTAVMAATTMLVFGAVLSAVARNVGSAIELAEHQRLSGLLEMTRATSRFLPMDFLRLLGKQSVIDVQLGDHAHREMSVLFSDLRSFTTMSEGLTPDETFGFVNDYFGRMVPLVRAGGGFLDKYVGDAMLALFEGTADDALRTAITMRYALGTWNAERAHRGLPAVRSGIGINTGSVVVGTIGGTERMDATVISDAVNVAARIEALTRELGASLLISEATYRNLARPEVYDLRRLGAVPIKGRADGVRLWEVFDGDDASVRFAKRSSQDLFERAVVHFEQREYATAREGFQRCVMLAPHDEVAASYVQRCDREERLLELARNAQDASGGSRTISKPLPMS